MISRWDLGKVKRGWVWSNLVQCALLRHLVLLDNLQREHNQITCPILFRLHLCHTTSNGHFWPKLPFQLYRLFLGHPDYIGHFRLERSDFEKIWTSKILKNGEVRKMLPSYVINISIIFWFVFREIFGWYIFFLWSIISSKSISTSTFWSSKNYFWCLNCSEDEKRILDFLACRIYTVAEDITAVNGTKHQFQDQWNWIEPVRTILKSLQGFLERLRD